MPEPAIRDLRIEQNTDWSETFSILVDGVAINLTGYTIIGKCRRAEEVSSPLLFNFAFSIATTVVTVSVAASVTAALSLASDPIGTIYYYDFILIEPSTKRQKIQKGRLTIERTVS
jgi:hypothetical protein